MSTSTEIKVPSDLHIALEADPQAKLQWDDLTHIARRDFISWITSAKQIETRQRRIEVACSKLKSGQRRPCCYAIVPMKLYRALDANPMAKAQWKILTPDARRDHVSWINEASDSQESQRRIEEVCLRLLQ